ncbi:hypothetical protein [Methylophaga thiooxydans]|uniref:hypothetical protein n=1 Tax=Methylophaga thiooxydans TaxID=392484 RepID=UPI002356648E|nr:hypothetical protein [Methylophaga thiooxydans]
MFDSIVIILVIIAVCYFLFRKQPSSPSVAGNLPGPESYEFDIVGESNYQDALEEICGGKSEESSEHYTEAILYLENDNPYDKQAVRVDIDGHIVGYLSRANTRAYRKQLKQMGHENLICSCKAVIVGGWRRSKSDEGNVGVKLDLPVS